MLGHEGNGAEAGERGREGGRERQRVCNGWQEIRVLPAAASSEFSASLSQQSFKLRQDLHKVLTLLVFSVTTIRMCCPKKKKKKLRLNDLHQDINWALFK